MARSLSLSLPLSFLLAACGSGSGGAAAGPFVAQAPDEGPGTSRPPPPPLPPPAFWHAPVWNEDAAPLGRTATFGSFPSDLVRYRSSLFTTDADAIEADGARIVAFDVGAAGPFPSARFRDVPLNAQDLFDADGVLGDASNPIGFGFFVNDLLVATDTMGFALVNAGGSDSAPGLSNLVVFDPTAGTIRQVVQLAVPYSSPAPLFDSAGAAVPANTFVQSQAEGVALLPSGEGRGLLVVAMANIVFGAPSYGAVKEPGTVQVFDVDDAAAAPVSARPTAGLSTQTLRTLDYDPVAVTRLANPSGPDRLLVTVAGTTGFDGSGRLVPVTTSSVEAYDATTLALLGRFDLGLAGLAGVPPAVGRDGVGHRVAYLASSVNGEAYALRLDGLLGPAVQSALVAVLRGPHNGIPVDPAAAGGPGGNVAGVALSTAGDVLVLSGFGDLFAFPAPQPGRLLALSLPFDVVGTGAFPTPFLPGAATVVTTAGRTLGPVAIVPGAGFGPGPEVFVAVGGAMDPATFLGAGPASIGSLDTFDRVR